MSVLELFSLFQFLSLINLTVAITLSVKSASILTRVWVIKKPAWSFSLVVAGPVGGFPKSKLFLKTPEIVISPDTFTFCTSA